jgi:hypothetical protein
VGSKERERRLAKERVDRSHRIRGRVGRPRRRHPQLTLGEKAALVLATAFISAEAILVAVAVLPGATLP